MGTNENLAERLAWLEDREALRELKHRYFHSADRHDLPGVKDCFAPEGAVIEFEGFPRCEGRESLVAMMQDQGGKQGFYTMHHGHNPLLTRISTDTAKGEWSLYFSAIDANAGMLTEIAGVYHETYTRLDSRWHIQTSRFERQSFLVSSIGQDGKIKAEVVGAMPASA